MWSCNITLHARISNWVMECNRANVASEKICEKMTERQHRGPNAYILSSPKYAWFSPPPPTFSACKLPSCSYGVDAPDSVFSDNHCMNPGPLKSGVLGCSVVSLVLNPHWKRRARLHRRHPSPWHAMDMPQTPAYVQQRREREWLLFWPYRMFPMTPSFTANFAVRWRHCAGNGRTGPVASRDVVSSAER